MSAQIHIGTSGWSYPKGEGTWKGHFYPTGKIIELEYYSQFFDTVELNSSFYSPPNPVYAANWVKQTPDGFLFTVKLWQKFTHPNMYRVATGGPAVISQEDVDAFNNSIAPLQESGKLGALLAQFPPSFKNDEYSRRMLGAVLRTFGMYPLAVELRHKSWSDDPATAALLTMYNACWVNIDEPKFESSVAEYIPVTSSEIAYFRFHGRNAEMWWRGDAETRYKYLYSPEEIGELSDKVREASEKTKLAFAFFNNHWQGYAPRNAVDLKKQMQLQVRDSHSPIEFSEDEKPRLL